MHAAKVCEKHSHPYLFGSAANNGDVENEELSAFNEALFVNSLLDPVEDDVEDLSGDVTVDLVSVNRRTAEIQVCLWAACDVSLLDSIQPDSNGTAAMEQRVSCVKESDTEELKCYSAIMDEARKRKRPMDLGTSDAACKRAQMSEVEGDAEITVEQVTDGSVAGIGNAMATLSAAEKEEILNDIVREFSLHNNEDQERAFRLVGDHFICNNGEQLLMFMTGIGGSGKSHVIRAIVKLF